MRTSGSLPIIALLFALSSCASVAADPPAIPPIRAERVPAPPASTVTLIWQPGHYDWIGSAYLWTPGEWVPRAGHGPLWQDGFWRKGPDGFVWEPAHWL